MVDNTARRGIYLPKELDDFFVENAKASGRKINSIMVEALILYKDTKEKKVSKNDDELKNKIDELVEAKLKGMQLESKNGISH